VPTLCDKVIVPARSGECMGVGPERVAVWAPHPWRCAPADSTWNRALFEADVAIIQLQQAWVLLDSTPSSIITSDFDLPRLGACWLLGLFENTQGSHGVQCMR
jgi:hypothetical protein